MAGARLGNGTNAGGALVDSRGSSVTVVTERMAVGEAVDDEAAPEGGSVVVAGARTAEGATADDEGGSVGVTTASGAPTSGESSDQFVVFKQ